MGQLWLVELGLVFVCMLPADMVSEDVCM